MRTITAVGVGVGEREQVGGQPAHGPGKLADRWALTETPGIDPRQVPAARCSAGDHPGQIADRPGNPARSVGDDQQPEQVDLRQGAGRPGGQRRLSGQQPRDVRTAGHQHRRRRAGRAGDGMIGGDPVRRQRGDPRLARAAVDTAHPQGRRGSVMVPRRQGRRRRGPAPALLGSGRAGRRGQARIGCCCRPVPVGRSGGDAGTRYAVPSLVRPAGRAVGCGLLLAQQPRIDRARSLTGHDHLPPRRCRVDSNNSTDRRGESGRGRSAAEICG